MRGGSCSSPTVSSRFRRNNRLLVGIGRTFEPTRSCTGSSAFASSHYAHASGQVLPLIRTLLKLLHHGLQARLRTFPDWLGDRGDRLLRFQVGKPRKPNRDHAAPARIRKDIGASAVIVASCDTADTDGSTEIVWSGRLRLRAGCRQSLQLRGPNALQTSLVRAVRCFDHTVSAIL